jgi:hypothetical protein
VLTNPALYLSLLKEASECKFKKFTNLNKLEKGAIPGQALCKE